MIELIYVSAAVDQVETSYLLDLLHLAQTNNKKLDVTGALMFSGTHFIQLLEGEEEEVLALYDKIARDPRHRDVLVVYMGEIEQRQFGKWSMAGANIQRLKYLENEVVDTIITAEELSQLPDINKGKRLFVALSELAK